MNYYETLEKLNNLNIESIELNDFEHVYNKNTKKYIYFMLDFYELKDIEKENILKIKNIVDGIDENKNKDKETKELIDIMINDDEQLFKLFVFEFSGAVIEDIKKLISICDKFKNYFMYDKFKVFKINKEKLEINIKQVIKIQEEIIKEIES